LARAGRDVQEIKQRQTNEITALTAELAVLERRLAHARQSRDTDLKAAERRFQEEAEEYERAIGNWDSG
jgi:predicted  nucleic acid-binding Zn-ribbon protein